jgi:hypothetical protein
MVISFQMEFILEQTPGKQVHDLQGEQLARYLALSKEKSDKINQLKLRMTNDRDI